MQVNKLPARHVAFEECKGYATYETARKHAEKILANCGCDSAVRYLIVALPSGRFMPVVVYNNENGHQLNIPYLANKNIGIIN